MSDQNQANGTNPSSRLNRPKFKTAAVMAEQTGLAQLPPELDPTPAEDNQAILGPLLHGPDGVFGSGSITNQVTRLSDPRLQTAQRQALVAHLGRVQGNRHLRPGASIMKTAGLKLMTAGSGGRCAAFPAIRSAGRRRRSGQPAYRPPLI